MVPRNGQAFAMTVGSSTYKAKCLNIEQNDTLWREMLKNGLF